MPIDHMPPRWRPGLKRLRAFLMTDATAIIILGVGILLRGLSYAPVVLGPPPPRGTHPAEMWLDMDIWAAVWITIGLICLIAPFTRLEALKVAALAGGTGITMLWGVSFLTQSITSDGRGWVTAIGYFTTVALVGWAVWRGKRGDIPLEHERRHQ